MKGIQDECDGVIFMGGQTIRPFTMGHRSFRKASEDLDAVITRESQLPDLYNHVVSRGGKLEYITEFGGLLGELQGTPLGFHISDIYGVSPENIQSWVFNDIGMLTAEMITALKLKRKKDNKWRGKDLLDIGSLLIAGDSGKIKYSPNTQDDIAKRVGSTSVKDVIETILKQNGFKSSEIDIINKINPSIS